MLLECSFSFRSSLSTRKLSMSADRCGMLDTHATVRSDAGVGGFSVEGDLEPWTYEQGNGKCEIKYYFNVLKKDFIKKY